MKTNDMYLKVENWIAVVHAGDVEIEANIKTAIDDHYLSLAETAQKFDRKKAVHGVLKAADAYKTLHHHEMAMWKQAAVYMLFGWTD